MNPQGPFGGGGAAGGGAMEPALMAFMVIVVLIAVAIGITIQVFFLLTLSRAFNNCRPENRTMEPGLVWLNLVPCLNIVWIFVTVIRLAASLRAEFAMRGNRREDDYGQNIGIAYNVLAFAGAIPFIGPVFSIGSLVCFIMYWVKIAGYNRELQESSADMRDEYDRYGDRSGDRSRDRDEPDDRYRAEDRDDRYTR
jgi:Na+/H+ antiporter NhaB